MLFINTEKKIVVAIMVFFTLIFCAISLVNHYNFRTYSLDLGLHNHAIFDYSHFRFNYSLLLFPYFEHRNQLSDHFDLMVMMLSPLSYIFGSYTLLLVQIFAIIYGGFGAYKFLKLSCSPFSYLPLIALFHFYVIWGIYSALAFDYHSSVVAAMLIPWYFYFIKKTDFLKATFVFFLVLFCKETMGLWLFFINIGLLIEYRKEKLKLKYLSILGSFGIIYFVSMIGFIIPSLSPSESKYIHFSFEAIGKNPIEALETLFKKPQYAFTLLFESKDPNTFGIKTELHLFVILVGGFALLLKPQYLIMLIPIFAQKLYNTEAGKWGINYHYSIEFVPIIIFAFYTWIIEKNIIKHKEIIAGIVAFSALFFSLKATDSPYSTGFSEVQIRYYEKSHYEQNFDVNVMHQIINKIPNDAIVSANSSLVPHLCFRDTIYNFPAIQNSDIIALIKQGGSTYPITQKENDLWIEKLKLDTLNYTNIYDKNSLVIFKNVNYKTALNF
jgi:uncharacterized membrane protein